MIGVRTFASFFNFLGYVLLFYVPCVRFHDDDDNNNNNNNNNNNKLKFDINFIAIESLECQIGSHNTFDRHR